MSFQVLQSRRSHRLTAQPCAQDAFDSLARLSRLAPGEEIFAQEAEARCYYRVVKGVVRSTHLSSDGRRQVGEFYFAGDMFGLALGALHRHAAEALTACEILIVKRATLSTAADAARIERLIWTVTSEQLEQAQQRMLLLARHTAYEKVAGFLAEIASRSEGPWICLPMCRQDIADYLGLTIETVSRMLTQLQQNGLVRLDGSRRFRITQAPRPAADLAA